MRSICLCLLPVALWVVVGVFCLVSLRVWSWFILVMMVGVMFGLGLVIVVTWFGGVRYVWLGLSANWRLIVSFACCGLGICDFWFFCACADWCNIVIGWFSWFGGCWCCVWLVVIFGVFCFWGFGW